MSRPRSPKSGAQPLRRPGDREVAVLLVALVLADLRGHVVERVVLGVERVDPLELELPPVGQLQRLVHLAALEQLLEDAERRRPGAHADGGARLGQRLGDGEAEAAVVGDAGDEGALPGEVDREHGRVSRWVDAR